MNTSELNYLKAIEDYEYAISNNFPESELDHLKSILDNVIEDKESN